MLHIGKIFGNLCQAIIEEFVENGRLNVSDCLGQINEHMKNEFIESYSESEVLEAFAALIMGQYLVQVDKSNFSYDANDLTKTVQKPDVGGKASKRRAQTALKEVNTKSRRNKKTKTNPIDEINLLSNDSLTKDIFARLGKNDR